MHATLRRRLRRSRCYLARVPSVHRPRRTAAAAAVAAAASSEALAAPPPSRTTHPTRRHRAAAAVARAGAAAAARPEASIPPPLRRRQGRRWTLGGRHVVATSSLAVGEVSSPSTGSAVPISFSCRTRRSTATCRAPTPRVDLALVLLLRLRHAGRDGLPRVQRRQPLRHGPEDRRDDERERDAVDEASGEALIHVKSLKRVMTLLGAEEGADAATLTRGFETDAQAEAAPICCGACRRMPGVGGLGRVGDGGVVRGRRVQPRRVSARKRPTPDLRKPSTTARPSPRSTRCPTPNAGRTLPDDLELVGAVATAVDLCAARFASVRRPHEGRLWRRRRVVPAGRCAKFQPPPPAPPPPKVPTDTLAVHPGRRPAAAPRGGAGTLGVASAIAVAGPARRLM